MKAKFLFSTVILAGILMTSLSSCGRRVVATTSPGVNVNVGGTTKHVPKTRKEIRLMKTSQRKGVLNY